MNRGMVFMDHMNFDIALQDYYKCMQQQTPRLDYCKLFRRIVEQKNAAFTKGFVFAPEPDKFLFQDEVVKM